MKTRFLSFTVGYLAIVASSALAGDWPQILGPSRNGKAEKEHLASEWPAEGPRVAWERSVGHGYAGVAVQGKQAILFHRVDDNSVVEALDVANGKTTWKVTFPTNYASGIAPDDGPRCVPLIAGELVYLFGAGGDLHALALEDGAERWSHDCFREFNAPEGYFGAGSTPILDSGRLMVNIGGKEGAGIVAFDPASGKVLWKQTDEQASYSSPTAATIDGKRHVVFVTRLNVVSVDPATGQARFRFPFGMRGPTVNAANPLVVGDHLFVTANYGIGANLTHIEKGEAKSVWESDEAISSQYTTAIEKDGFLYGIHGRQDAGVARLRCIELLTGKPRWTEEGFGSGTLLLADDKLIILKTDGRLILARPNPDKYQELASAEVFHTTAQALPALANGRLFIRDTRTLKCLELDPR